MIAGIDYQTNIDVLLEKKELDKLKDSILEGILIKTDDPEEQGTIRLSINEERRKENGYGIGIDYKDYWKEGSNFKLALFIGKRYYEHLKEKGEIKAMQAVLTASQISIHDISRVCASNILKIKDL